MTNHDAFAEIVRRVKSAGFNPDRDAPPVVWGGLGPRRASLFEGGGFLMYSLGDGGLAVPVRIGAPPEEHDVEATANEIVRYLRLPSP